MYLDTIVIIKHKKIKNLSYNNSILIVYWNVRKRPRHL